MLAHQLALGQWAAHLCTWRESGAPAGSVLCRKDLGAACPSPLGLTTAGQDSALLRRRAALLPQQRVEILRWYREADPGWIAECRLPRALDEHHVDDADDLAAHDVVDRAAAIAGIGGCVELEDAERSPPA